MCKMQNDEELKPAFKRSLGEFWLQTKIQKDYPLIWEKVKLFSLPSQHDTWLREDLVIFFSLQSKQRQKLMIATRGDLRLMLTNMSPDIQKIMMNNQAQGSH